MQPEGVSKDRDIPVARGGGHGHPPGKQSGVEGEGEVLNNKKDAAVRFIQAIQRMDPRQLHALISREAGEDLAQFFMSYSATLIARDPERVLQNGSSLMLMGYLIRTQEERRKEPAFEQPLAYA
jgi:hypothetical protein